PHQAGDQVVTIFTERVVKDIDAGVITKTFAENVDGVRWPEMNAVREEVDVRDVKTEVAEIHRRLNLHLVPVVVEEPNKRTKGEDGEERGDDPCPDVPISPRWRVGSID